MFRWEAFACAVRPGECRASLDWRWGPLRPAYAKCSVGRPIPRRALRVPHAPSWRCRPVGPTPSPSLRHPPHSSQSAGPAQSP
eukprot:scaffold3884_cov392-Prasinococcus_capsulatus_cf.AAC.8